VFLQRTFGSVNLDTDILPRNPLFFKYSYQSFDYDDVLRNDMVIQDVTLGWTREVSDHLNLLLSGGPVLVKADEHKRNWGYNSRAELNYLFERGRLRMAFEKGYEKDMFSDVDEETLSDFYVVKSDLICQPIEDLSVVLFGSYRHEDKQKVSLVDEITPTEEVFQGDESQELTTYFEKQYTVGARINYKFGRWYAATLGYQYTDFDSEQDGEDYQESQVYLTLQAQKELLRW